MDDFPPLFYGKFNFKFFRVREEKSPELLTLSFYLLLNYASFRNA